MHSHNPHCPTTVIIIVIIISFFSFRFYFRCLIESYAVWNTGSAYHLCTLGNCVRCQCVCVSVRCTNLCIWNKCMPNIFEFQKGNFIWSKLYDILYECVSAVESVLQQNIGNSTTIEWYRADCERYKMQESCYKSKYEYRALCTPHTATHNCRASGAGHTCMRHTIYMQARTDSFKLYIFCIGKCWRSIVKMIIIHNLCVLGAYIKIDITYVDGENITKIVIIIIIMRWWHAQAHICRSHSCMYCPTVDLSIHMHTSSH